MQIKKNTLCELKDGSFVEAVHGKRTNTTGGEQVRVADLRLCRTLRGFVHENPDTDRLLYTCDIREVYNGAERSDLEAVLIAEQDALSEAILKK